MRLPTIAEVERLGTLQMLLINGRAKALTSILRNLFYSLSMNPILVKNFRCAIFHFLLLTENKYAAFFTRLTER